MSTVAPRPDLARVGDRLPDVRLQPAAGERLRLHADLAGRALWLAVVRDQDEAAALPALAAGAGLCIGAAPIAPPPGWTAYVADAAWCALFPAGMMLRLDPNLRVRAILPPAAFPGWRDDAHCEALDAGRTAGCAPVLQIPDVLDAGLCDRLVAHLDQDCGGGEPSRVLVHENGQTRAELDPSVKLRRETFIRDAALEAEVQGLLLRRVLPEIARVFQFPAARRDPFKLLAYPAGAGYFRPHRDNDTRDVAHRRFAASFNLNPGGYSGGEFRFPEFGPHLYAPPRGAALVFSCSLLHEVVPVQAGTRRALTTFLS